MKLNRLKVFIKSKVETGEMYSSSLNTLCKMSGESKEIVESTSIDLGYTVFVYEKETYIGCRKRHDDYYYDKLLGQNPFYQTS